jgi:hypothetical protein
VSLNKPEIEIMERIGDILKFPCSFSGVVWELVSGVLVVCMGIWKKL